MALTGAGPMELNVHDSSSSSSPSSESEDLSSSSDSGASSDASETRRSKPNGATKKPRTKQPVKKAAAAAKAENPPPPPSSPPPPPPPPPPMDGSSSQSMSSSSLSSSDSDSSDLSDEQPRNTLATKRSKKPTANADSLKVKLKLPPGFQSTNGGKRSSKSAAPSKRERPPAPKKAPIKQEPSASAPTKKAASAIQVPVNGNDSSTLSNPIAVGIQEKLIPTGPTEPEGEVRGARELKLLGFAEIAKEVPEEMKEEDVPTHFNDAFATELDPLRNLDLFYFCDERGNAINLEVLDRDPEDRPRIMGFGTLVRHLPPADRPVPVKYILPSPAFPSRSKKRRRSDSLSPSPSASHSSASKKKNRPVRKTSRANGRKHAIDSDFDSSDGGSFMGTPSSGALHGDSDSVSDVEMGRGEDGAQSERSSRFSSSGSDSNSSSGSSSSSEDENSNMEEKASTPTPSLDAEAKQKAQLRNKNGQFVRDPTSQRSQRSRNSTSPVLMNRSRQVDELMKADSRKYDEANGTRDELNLRECGFRYPPEYERVRVWLPEITDWCLDYAEGDPTLWVITEHAWYKIAGPLSGLLPHGSYRPKFRHVRMLFEASYLVAYVLKEWVPQNKKVSYRATLQQIVELSLKGRYHVSASFLIEHYPFIQNQIADLFPDRQTLLDSMFFRQLHRLHENFRAREAKKRHRREQLEQKEAERKLQKNRRLQQLEDEKQKWRELKEEERKQKEEEKKYPIDDLELLQETGDDPNYFPITMEDCLGVDKRLLGDLVMLWQTITTFKDFVALPEISLEELASYLTSKRERGTSLGISQIFVAFLRAILAEKSFTSVLDDLVVEGNMKVSDLFGNAERSYGMCERPLSDVLNAVTWPDILRQLMSKDLGLDASIGHTEPLVGCEIVRQTLYMQNNSVPFNDPVDVSLPGLVDYAQVVKKPMDLGTIKKKLDAGEYERDGGAEVFAKHMRLVWDNAVLYNGEESDVGRAALALSDVFEQSYERFVSGRVRANKQRIEGCQRVEKELALDKEKDFVGIEYADVVFALYSFEFQELPVAHKTYALSWLCSEFLKLSSVRAFLEEQLKKEETLYKDYRKTWNEYDRRRKNLEKDRRDKELKFRADCQRQGIPLTSHNVFSDATKRKHAFIQEFYDQQAAQKATEDQSLEEEKSSILTKLESGLEDVTIRESPVGKDRHYNCYWVFRKDDKQRLFVERSDTGEFAACQKADELEKLLEWLNPKGVRELDLLTNLKKVKDRIQVETLTSSDETGPLDAQQVELNLFPLPGAPLNPDTYTVDGGEKGVDSHGVAIQMLRTLQNKLVDAHVISSDWDTSAKWTSRVSSAASCADLRVLFGELEEAVMTSRSGGEAVRKTWKRKRREWRLALEGSKTYAQLVFLLHLLLDECVNVEGFMDLFVRLSREDWLKLRPVKCHSHVPDAGDTIVYFGDGHKMALKEDGKVRKKRFTQESDGPVTGITLVCNVNRVSYHHGGGDPYALVMLHPLDATNANSMRKSPGSMLCSPPSPLQTLSRILLRIVNKVKLHEDAGPFLEPVSLTEFPEYREIVIHPMDLGKITRKAQRCEYSSGKQLLKDVKLVCSNCELFCEGRFPALPPLARSVMLMMDAQLKRAAKDIKACEEAIQSAAQEAHVTEDVLEVNENMDKGNVPEEIVAILRLENRLPEYIVDVNKYENAIQRSWQPGDHFRLLYRDPKGFPTEYYGGKAAGSLPYDKDGLLPWEALRVIWDEDDGSDDNRINPWEAERDVPSKKQ